MSPTNEIEYLLDCSEPRAGGHGDMDDSVGEIVKDHEVDWQASVRP